MTELNEPRWGDVYEVPVLIDPEIGRTIPVLHDRAHADPELGNPVVHHHIDYRFVRIDELKRWFPPGGWLNRKLRSLSNWYRIVTPVLPDVPGFVVEVRRRRCLRVMPYSPLTGRAGGRLSHLFPASGMREVAESLAAAGPLADCARCPHKGTNLVGAVEVDGVAVCPAHGLLIDRRTCRVLPFPV